MPLLPPTLASALADVAASPPATAAECAQAWADAVQSYAAAVVPPSTTAAAAGSALAGALVAGFAPPDASAAMSAAFTAFAATLGGGMAPAFVAVPPPSPCDFASLFAGPKPATHAEAGLAIATLIDTWMRTGTATPASGGAAVPWS
jgi:hypothetical protein